MSDLNVACGSAGFQNEIAETYATAGVVSIQGRLALGGKPAAEISFRRTSALAFKGHKLGFDQAQLVALGKSLNSAIQAGLVWNRNRVIVTQIWRAEGFTHLVAGKRGSAVHIEATAKGAVPGFNYADPGLGLHLTTQRTMSYCAVGQTEIKPYFAVHKLRENSPGQWSLYRYGLR